MPQTRTASATATYTVLDIEKVVRRVKGAMRCSTHPGCRCTAGMNLWAVSAGR